MVTGDHSTNHNDSFICNGEEFEQYTYSISEYYNFVVFPIRIFIKTAPKIEVGIFDDFFSDGTSVKYIEKATVFTLEQIQSLLKEKYGEHFARNLIVSYIDENHGYGLTDDIEEFLSDHDKFEVYIGKRLLIRYYKHYTPLMETETLQLLRAEKLQKIMQKRLP